MTPLHSSRIAQASPGETTSRGEERGLSCEAKPKKKQQKKKKREEEVQRGAANGAVVGGGEREEEQGGWGGVAGDCPFGFV